MREARVFTGDLCDTRPAVGAEGQGIGEMASPHQRGDAASVECVSGSNWIGGGGGQRRLT
jgi:hypothetical protein